MKQVKSMDMTENRVLEWCKNNNLINSGDTIICGVSGGADSIAMLIILNKLSKYLNINVEVAHFNHCIRGEESDRDAKFVEDYCKDNNITYHYGYGDVIGYAKEHGLGTEEAARILRYEFLEGIKPSQDTKVATAHHADDNLETVIMKIIRGTGINGLCGIPPKRGSIIRPLLCLTRDEIMEYLDKNGVEHVEDSTNASDDYLRNRIRHNVLPILREENPDVSVNTVNMCYLLKRDNTTLEKWANDIVDKATIKLHTYNANVIKELSDGNVEHCIHAIMKRENLEEFSQTNVISIAKLIYCNKVYEGVKCKNGVMVVLDHGELIIYDKKSYEESKCQDKVHLELNSEIVFNGYKIRYEEYEGEIPADFDKKHEFYIDSDKTDGQLVVRTRENGDKLVLNAGTKTLGKIFTERKIPYYIREKLPVISDDKGVVAVCDIGASLTKLATNKGKSLRVTVETL